MEIKRLVDSGLSIRQIAKTLGKTNSQIRTILKNSGLKTNHINPYQERGVEKKNCRSCDINLDEKNYYKNKKTYCRKCLSKYISNRIKEFKIKCLEYKGFNCIKCGYNKSVSAMEFHHRDPSMKDFDISKARNLKLEGKVKDELDKCDLLCCRCHREEHERLNLE